MNTKFTITDTLAHYLKMAVPNPNCDCASEINGACDGLAELLESMQSRITALEKQLKQDEAQNRRTANIASCLANGIQPD